MSSYFSAISSNPIIQAILFLLLLWFLWSIRFILVVIFIAFIISSTLHPFTTYLEKKNFPIWAALAIPYLVFTAIFFVVILPLIPFLITQSTQFVANFPSEIERAGGLLGFHISLSDIQNFLRAKIETIGTSAVTLTIQTFSLFIDAFVTLFISIYLLADREKIQDIIVSFGIIKNKNQTLHIFQQIEQQLGAWARGQVILSGSIALANFFAYIIIGLPYALPLAFLAGLLEIIPSIGPILAAIPAVIVGLTISFSKAIFVVIVYILIQIVEGNFLVPRIMKSAVGLHPIVVILAILIGSELLGILGALISIPLVSLCTVIWKQTHNPS